MKTTTSKLTQLDRRMLRIAKRYHIESMKMLKDTSKPVDWERYSALTAAYQLIHEAIHRIIYNL